MSQGTIEVKDDSANKSFLEKLFSMQTKLRRPSDTFDQYKARIDPDNKIKEAKLLKLYLQGYITKIPGVK